MGKAHGGSTRGHRLRADGLRHRPGLGAGWQVSMRDVDEAATNRGMTAIRDSLGRFLSKGKITQEEAEATLARITPTTDLEAVADADVVVEAIYEKVEAKHEVFRALDKICKGGAVLGTNTS